jgi:hypothetical protein
MKKDEGKIYQSILVIVVGFVILSLIFKIKILLTIGLMVGILSLASKTVAGWINYGWYKIAEWFGWINSKILITLVYYLVLVPISALSKLKHKDVLKRNRREVGTYYSDRDHLYVPKDFENLW